VSSIAAALDDARRHGLARLDAQWLLAHLLQHPRTWLLAHDDESLDPALRQRYDSLCSQRADGVPLAYLTGEREFHGLTLAVTPAVLVPRPETEGLVDWGLELLAGPLAAISMPHVADLGTGSGAVVLAVGVGCPRARLTAVERSATALAVARLNGLRLGPAVDWQLGDWWQPLAGRRFDLVLSNPPYVADADPHLAALQHEPIQALTAGALGLDDLQTIVAGAVDHLRPGGWLVLEHGHDQGDAVSALLRRHGLGDVACRADLAGLPRCSAARVASV
jgi:release factor glutamine methyltransferase